MSFIRKSWLNSQVTEMLIVTFVRICVFNRCGVIDIVIACVGLPQPLSIVGCFVALIFEVILSYRLPLVYNLLNRQVQTCSILFC